MPLLFLNDKSYMTTCEPRRASRAMTEFVKTAVAVWKLDGSTMVVSKVPLPELEIVDGYPVGKWLGDHKANPEWWRRLRRLQTKSPYKAVYPEDMDSLGVEYQYEGVEVEGLGAAHLMGGLGISLPVHSWWEATNLTLRRLTLLDADEEPVGSDVDVRHVSGEPHIEAHLAWIKECRDTAARTGAELWEKRDKICPSLQFLDGAEKQLRKLDPVSVPTVRKRLLELEEKVAEWASNPELRLPDWGDDVRGEHKQRELLCWFTDRDGVSRLFEWHTDFRPEPGRIHFRHVKEERTIRIAHIGRKLGV
ncbi:hypothetical protein ABT063_13540 [Streptomyces sp. NPDC002838]|uniref:hypothetical protein n=1 Tax=Streptomyces sp. NPDC002838 TaxID=3154436 RepID=UPI00331E25F8